MSTATLWRDRAPRRLFQSVAQNRSAKEKVAFAAANDGIRSDASFGGRETGVIMWARGYGGFGSIDAAPSVAATEFHAHGAALGLEKRRDETVLGLGVGFTAARGHAGEHAFDIETVQFQLYGGGTVGPFEVFAAAGAGRNSIDSKRTVTVGLASDVALASYNGWTIGAARANSDFA